MATRVAAWIRSGLARPLGEGGDADQRHGEERGEIIQIDRGADLPRVPAMLERSTERGREPIEVRIDVVPTPRHRTPRASDPRCS